MEIWHHSLPAKANFGPIESDLTAISTIKPRPAGSQPELRRVVWNRQVQHYGQLSFLARYVAYFPSELHSARPREASSILPGRSLRCPSLDPHQNAAFSDLITSFNHGPSSFNSTHLSRGSCRRTAMSVRLKRAEDSLLDHSPSLDKALGQPSVTVRLVHHRLPGKERSRQMQR